MSATPSFADQALSSRSIAVFLMIFQNLIEIFGYANSADFLEVVPTCTPQVLMHLPTQQPLLVLSSHLHWDQVRLETPSPVKSTLHHLHPYQAAGHQSSEAQELLCLLEDMSADYEQISGFRCWVLIGMAM